MSATPLLADDEATKKSAPVAKTAETRASNAVPSPGQPPSRDPTDTKSGVDRRLYFAGMLLSLWLIVSIYRFDYWARSSPADGNRPSFDPRRYESINAYLREVFHDTRVSVLLIICTILTLGFCSSMSWYSSLLGLGTGVVLASLFVLAVRYVIRASQSRQSSPTVAVASPPGESVAES